ncbi:PAS domain S-box-containing protein [Pricia antarctica]|uniref:histidine kinase n=1 Tax=Pricia antarctica TaxID=641691 RepID=A0A1G7I7G9_9FLAO|nr:PAS domain-containing sensor histidine kinase [Pricia antarctica]SDF08697.1 PAS domain S-box-containing protein [Pricia antarctica]
MLDNDNLYFLDGSGEMATLHREKNWSATPLGPPQNWPQSLRATLDIMLNSLFPMFLFWGDGHYCFYNDAYRPSLGNNGKHPSILGKGGRESWPEIWDDIGPMLKQVMEKGIPIWNEDLLLPIFRNGRIEDVYWTFCYSPVRDGSGNPAGVLTVCTETTDAVLANERLTESEQRFRGLADQSPMWIWMTDAEINVEYANRDLLDYIGLENISDFTGQVWQHIVHPEDLKIVTEAFSKAAEKRSGFSVDYRVRSAETGLYEWFTVKGVPRFEDGTLTGFIGTGMNVHRQKTFSEQLRKEVGMRTKELADSNNELEKSNKELQSFAYISSHDLQEPLRKIQTFCSILLASEYNRLSQKGKEKFDRMQSAAKRMQVLINDLLAYSRLDMEERNFETTELRTIVNEVKDDLTDEIAFKNAIVNLESSCDIVVVLFQFRQLLYNLISNSLKYVDKDTAPVIEISASPVRSSEIADSRAVPEIEYVHIRVSDNGIGFENGFSEKIFEVFQRLHGRDNYRGTGVGLAIVKKIAENHGGFVTAHGEPGRGADFNIYIPMRDKAFLEHNAMGTNPS